MKKLSFKHTAHWLIFTLANLLILFAACSKDSDNNDDNLKYGTVTLNREKKKITRAEYKNAGGGDYLLLLYLNNSDKERVELALNKDNHMKGNTIVLTQDDRPKQGWRWAVEFYDSNGNKIIAASGIPGQLHFTQGTLTVSDTPRSGSVNISLKNGKVMGLDGKTEYPLTLNYSGEMKEVE